MGEERAALMRRIAKLAVAEDEAVLQQMREQRSGQTDAPVAGSHVLPQPAAKVRFRVLSLASLPGVYHCRLHLM